MRNVFRSIKNLALGTLCCIMVGRAYAQDAPLGNAFNLNSPNGDLQMHFSQKANAQGQRTFYYSLSYKNKAVVNESVIDIDLDNHLSESAMALKVDTHQRWCENLKIVSVKRVTVDTTWVPVCGERATIPDHYNTLVLSCVKDDNPIYKVNLEFRLYDEGLGFRFFFPENEKGTYYRITAEHTTFAMPAGTKAWVAYWAQAPYQLLPLADWKWESERPLTLQLPNGLYACLTEAQMVDYARTKFKLSAVQPNTIETSMYTPADLISPFATPWRVVMVADKPGDLIEHNYLVLNLNQSKHIANTDWIKPGKIMRVMSLTTQDACQNIDFAAKHHLQYVLFDWKWYGPAFSFNSDATKVAIPDFDLPAIISYGKSKGIGVWLYVNQQGLLAQSDSLFRVYHQWGIKGVKFGFVQAGSHRWTTWIEKAIQQAADNHIMLNIHDDWRPTGEQRTWPNLMTAEGIRGNEEMPDATHNTVLPFTRYIAGPADYTICYYSNRIKTTHAHQLALAVVYYSPIQTLFWYDKPAQSNNEPELEFWDNIPTVWDDTRVLQGTPGQYVATARRTGHNWFLGCITNTQSRDIDLPLNFLDKDKKYMATIYTDDAATPGATHVKLEHITVNSTTRLKISLQASGGEAVQFVPVP